MHTQRVQTPENERPWGRYDVLSSKPGYQVKTITVNSGCRLSLQKHQHRSEHWVVVRGYGVATLADSERLLEVGDCISINVNNVHRIENPGDTALIFVEVQMGNYLGEDDIIRLADDFGRD